MKTARLLFLMMLLVTGFGFLASCGGGGGGGGDTPLQPPAYNATGTWAVTENDKNGNCPQMAPLYSFNLSVDHPSGSNSLVVTDQKTGMQYPGTISGRTVNYSGPSIDSNCPAGISIAVTLSMSSDVYLSGSANWNCNYYGGSCSGTTSFNASKTGGGADTTKPTVPTGLSVVAASTSQINLSWVASMDNVGVVGYRVYRSASFLKQVGGTSTSETGLSANTQYCYSVSAVDAASNESAQSAQQCATTLSGGGGDTTPPSTPTSLSVSIISSSQLNVTWTASMDNVGVTGYRLERCQGASCSSFSQIATPATNSYSNTGLSASTSYTYRVRAVDAAGNLSGYSNTYSATTPAGGDITPPSTPTNLTGSAVSTSQINLSWTASTDSVGVSGYKVYGDDHNNLTPLWFIKNVTGTSTSMTGLIAAAEYCYRVSAFDAAGNESLYSSQFCATTQSAGPTTVTLYAAKDAEIIWSDASTAYANTNYGNSATMEIGNYYQVGAYIDSYLKAGFLVDFTFDPATWNGKTIISAKLRLYVYDYAVQKTGRYVAYKIVDTMSGSNYQYPWTETGVTWNNAPNYYLSPTSTAYPPYNPTEYTEWDVTSMVQEWFTSGTMGNGIIIFDMNAPPSIYITTNQITTYYSRNNATQALRPQLIITY